MKLSKAASADAFCPVCALDGIISKLDMQIDSLAISCGFGHTFDTLQLSKLASIHETTPKTSPEIN